MVAQALLDRDAFARWFGEFTSTPKYPDTDWSPEAPMTEAEVAACLADHTPLCRNGASRYAFIRKDADTVLLFVDGHSYECSGPAQVLAEELCARDRVELTAEEVPAGPSRDLLITLINQGSLAFDGPEEEDD